MPLTRSASIVSAWGGSLLLLGGILWSLFPLTRPPKALPVWPAYLAGLLYAVSVVGLRAALQQAEREAIAAATVAVLGLLGGAELSPERISRLQTSTPPAEALADAVVREVEHYHLPPDESADQYRERLAREVRDVLRYRESQEREAREQARKVKRPKGGGTSQR